MGVLSMSASTGVAPDRPHVIEQQGQDANEQASDPGDRDDLPNRAPVLNTVSARSRAISLHLTGLWRVCVSRKTSKRCDDG